MCVCIQGFLYKNTYFFSTSSLHTWVPFVSFSYLIMVSRTSNPMLLIRSDESGHPCLFPDLKNKTKLFYFWNMGLFSLCELKANVYFFKLKVASASSGTAWTCVRGHILPGSRFWVPWGPGLHLPWPPAQGSRHVLNACLFLSLEGLTVLDKNLIPNAQNPKKSGIKKQHISHVAITPMILSLIFTYLTIAAGRRWR